MKNDRMTIAQRDTLLVFTFALASRIIVCALLALSPRVLPAFDASAELLLGQGNRLEGFVRWDVLHFIRIAQQGGYRLEKDFAFQPGVPLLFALAERVFPGRSEASVLFVVILANAASIGAALILHQLSYAYTRSHHFSKMTALLFCLSPAAYVLSVPLTEPFFAFFAFGGMLLAQNGRLWVASLAFAVATTLRANGLLNAGFLVWHALFEPWMHLSSRQRITRTFHSIALTLIVCSPFGAVQRYAFVRLCQELSMRPWCFHRLPIVYSFVQSHYWNVGLFRYWTLQQLPLFVLSAPVLAISLAASASFYSTLGADAVWRTLPFLRRPRAKPAVQSKAFHAMSLLPAIHLHTSMTLVLLFASHVQICIRQASTDPVIFWYAASLLQGRSVWGRRWVTYSVLWGCISILLWATFLPPA